MRHAVVRILCGLICRLDVLDRLIQLFIKILDRRIERTLVWNPKDHLQAVVCGRNGDDVGIRLRLPAFRQLELNAGFFMRELFDVLTGDSRFLSRVR